MKTLENITVATLRDATEIAQKRDDLLKEAGVLTARLAKLLGGKVPGVTAPDVKVGFARGELTKEVIALLEKAPDHELTIDQMVAGLNAKHENVLAWIYTTAKKLPQIQKVETGRYRLVKVPRPK